MTGFSKKITKKTDKRSLLDHLTATSVNFLEVRKGCFYI